MLSKSTIKYIQSLQHKKFRYAEQVFVAEGPKLVEELLAGNKFICRKIYALESWNAGEIKVSENFVEVIRDFELEKISSLSTPNHVLALFEMNFSEAPTQLKNKLTLVLDDIQDPGNLGTIIRIADWFGVENIVCSMQSADRYNSKVVQSTMASLQHVKVFYTDLPGWMESIENVPVFAASLHGDPLPSVAGATEGIIIIGNESKGISDALLKYATRKINITKIGHAESLNAAVATGIILYELTRK